MTTSKHIYFAAPLFAQSDLFYNQHLVKKIRELPADLTVYLPQENDGINDKSAYADSKMIALADTEEVIKSDLMIALLDGLTIDAGVASEIGVAYAKGIPILALYTDSRQQGADNQKKLAALKTPAENQFHYLNLYTVGLVKLNGAIVATEDALLEKITAFLEGRNFYDL
ncbi:nucleoside 2-deoxyribosyltransferase [Enterococcus dongliensis]|uniref:Nucleoside 2-deoxyribosyltransferase n=1 Tax=Enterococcus dongliensis TaxID=2559925 RepID=A0AAP5KNV7_9ENTE|nr:nucleoside 2-deoxyribosyltransferase [Enterococcus dongliensis]MDT2595662.1 nucleoside 2-deoxyribosyltransferase [Enterococcus dongliensis]MDT2604257.1 nucleoside 2-deoxyribosyltransferase [Enterococcus dongliensis]MDT2635043.1 nucleoside 2-deoxyribosyltransferase [Enterococcus dongliensis]MDT2636274.1 nucleoside 2-deoxyribosyltransferase [Enterococcus dongliensis]MDT2640381.1 nucleoside 2-deoxyribosyltransferase [Enterococcus dongliensis]